MTFTRPLAFSTTRFRRVAHVPSRLRASIVAAAMACASSPALAQDGTFSWSAIGSGNQDANVGLSTSKTYLNAVDAGGWGGIVNGVTFARGNFNSNLTCPPVRYQFLS